MPDPTAIDWPEDTLGCALRATYVDDVAALVQVTGVEDGPNRFRLVADKQARSIRATFVWSADQLAAFEAFLLDTLDAGTAWFNMAVPTGAGFVPFICHLSGTRRTAPHPDSFERFAVELTLEAFPTAFVPPPPFVGDDPIDATGPATPPADVIDARSVADTRPTDIVNALAPVAW